MMDYAKAFMKVYAKVCDMETSCKVAAANNMKSGQWSDAKDCESDGRCYGYVRKQMDDILNAE